MKNRLLICLLCLFCLLPAALGRAESLFLQDFVDAEVQKKGKLFSLWTVEEQYYFIETLREMAKDHMDALPPGVEDKLNHQYGLPQPQHIPQAAALQTAQEYIRLHNLIPLNNVTQVKTFFYLDIPQVPVWHFSFCRQFDALVDIQVCATTGHIVHIIWPETQAPTPYELYRQQLDAKYAHYYEVSLEEKAILEQLLLASGGTPAAAFRAGLPDETVLSQHLAEQFARNHLRSEYRLPEHDLSQLTAYFDYNVVDPARPVWHVYFCLDGAELESYTVHLDAKTGRVILSYGPGEGNG